MEIEQSLNKKEAVKLLRALADALDTNTTCDIPIDQLTVPFGSEPSIELEYEEYNDEVDLEIEFKWNKNDTAGTPAERQARFEVFQGKDEQFYFHLKAANNQIILASEGYSTKQSAEQGVTSVIENSKSESFEERTSKIGQSYFVLKAGNGEIVGVSQMYKRKASCKKGIKSVIHSSSNAEIIK